MGKIILIVLFFFFTTVVSIPILFLVKQGYRAPINLLPKLGNFGKTRTFQVGLKFSVIL
jgi:hypothetical protein